ncbi:MAG: folC [Sedimentibacter sp.]|nr:folC [Sedimentibacter sp.]
MNYEQAISYIRAVHNNGTKLGLERGMRLKELLGNPQDSYKIIHVAGTNGKGSTCNMIHDVLAESGYKTGLFISPHLEDFTERIQINKVPIDTESLVRITQDVKEKIDIMHEEGFGEFTEFEVVTAIGFKYFQEQNIDVLVLEVGMGGRHDASNVVKDSIVSVITSISLDHTEYLGNTLAEIAWEKAGIIKENSNVVIYPQQDEIVEVIVEEAKKKNSKAYLANPENIRIIKSDLTGQVFEYLKKDVFNLDELKINFLGEHQIYNVATVLLALEVIKKAGFNITEKSIISGLEESRYPGRFEVISENPVVILDGAHNINGIEYFAKAVTCNFKEKKITLFYGMLKDKNPESVLSYLFPISKKIYTITPNSPRAMSSHEMAEMIRKHTDVETVALNNSEDIIDIIDNMDKDEVAAFVGSLYMIGEVRTIIKNHQKKLNFGK